MIKPNFFLVDIDTSKDKYVLDEDGFRTNFPWLESTSFEMYQNRNQEGVITHIPKENYGLRVGDRVFIRHFLADEDFEVKVGDKTLFRTQYKSIFAYERDGEVKALHDYFFVKPTDKNKGEVVYTSDETSFLKKGIDVVLLPKCEYVMYINNQVLWRVKKSFLVAEIEF